MFAQNKILLPTLVVLQVISWVPIMSLPQGAPETVCDTMLPFHGGGGIHPQYTVAPFRIETSSSVVGQGQTIRVDIVGVPDGLKFGGFMIQARNRNPPYQIIGQFNPTLDGRTVLMNCENSVNNSVTHSSPAPKNDISLEWQSPVNFLGQVVFNATVAQSYETFWVGISSNPVQIVRRDAAPSYGGGIPPRQPAFTPTRAPYVPQPQPTPAIATPADPIYTNCGRTKTCFGLPANCMQTQNCKVISAITVRGDIYEFEIKSDRSSPAYIALGLSEDNKMGDDLVIECFPQNGRVNMYSSYTSGAPNYGVSRIGVPQNTARLLQSSFIDGAIYCKVQRDPVTNVKGKTFDLINNKYHILLAAGNSIKDNGVGYHDIGRIPSASPVSLAVVQDLAASSTLLLRLHGAFMVAAWIGTTSLGILLARYFKQTWVGSQTCGKDQWFVWHRVCMVTTWSLTMVAFVLIFVEIGGWSREPHAIVGVITTILCFIQPIGALFRPAPTSSKRPIFNWAHWLGGNLAHICSLVTIFLAVNLTKAELPEWMDWVLVAFVVFHVIVHLIYSIAGFTSDRKQSKRVNTFQMGDMGHHHHHHHHGRNGMKLERNMDAPYAALRKGLLAVYIIVLVLFVVALILIVVLAPIEDAFKSVQNQLNN